MSKIGVIGPRGEVMTFLAAGFAVYEAEDVSEAADALRKAADECAILYLSPVYADALSAEIAASCARRSRSYTRAYSTFNACSLFLSCDFSF